MSHVAPSTIDVPLYMYACHCCVLAPYHVLVHEQCRSEASLCQAVENFTLALTCSQCDDNDTVTWLFSPGRQKDYFHSLSQQNKTLLLAGVNAVRKKTAGCYLCLCDNMEAKE